MDCNQVFFALTSRPFPSGSPDDSFIECHLLDCESCRQIAEALRPSDAIEHESLTPAERRVLPQYHSEMSTVPAAPSAMEARLHANPMRNGAEAPRYPMVQRSPLLLDRYQRPQQLAAFSIAPPRRRNRLAEAATLAAIASLVALGSWGLGWIAM